MKMCVLTSLVVLNLFLPLFQIVPMIENLPEYKALEDEDGRRAAFSKYVKRQKVLEFLIFGGVYY